MSTSQLQSESFVLSHVSLSRRSSLASSFVTGLVGWNGLALVAWLVLGAGGGAGARSPWLVFAWASACAATEVALLRAAFFALRMNRGVWIGAAWGGVVGGALATASLAFVPFIGEHPIAWVVIAAYIGAPVGGFLSYFQRDDARIERSAAATASAPRGRYGRDAHWLEPFAFGAALYALVYLPRSPSVAVSVIVVGAVSGVFAAGASHFSPDSWKRSVLALASIALALGGVQGVITGWMLRGYAAELWASHLWLGAFGGALTYAVTLARGRALARREEALR